MTITPDITLKDLLLNAELREVMQLELEKLLQPENPAQQPDCPTYIVVRDDLGMDKHVARTRDVVLSLASPELLEAAIEAAGFKQYEQLSAERKAAATPEGVMALVIAQWQEKAATQRTEIAQLRDAGTLTAAETALADGVLKYALRGLDDVHDALCAEESRGLHSLKTVQGLKDKYGVTPRVVSEGMARL
jgi:hypothetical protein